MKRWHTPGNAGPWESDHARWLHELPGKNTGPWSDDRHPWNTGPKRDDRQQANTGPWSDEAMNYHRVDLGESSGKRCSECGQSHQQAAGQRSVDEHKVIGQRNAKQHRPMIWWQSDIYARQRQHRPTPPPPWVLSQWVTCFNDIILNKNKKIFFFFFYIWKVMYQLNITKLLYSVAAAHATAQPSV